MKISDVAISEAENFNELSGQIGDFRVWYRIPKQFKLSLRADAFVAAGLISAMYCGEDLEIEEGLAVSPLLLKNCETIQDIFLLWGPYFGKPFHRVKIVGGSQLPAPQLNPLNVSFFSGGVDGTHTFLRHQEEIDFLLFAKGIDMQLSNDENYNYALKLNTEYLQSKGKKMYPLETNVRFLGHEFGLSWNICFGGGLSSIALAGGFQSCYIASGISYADLYPHGSSFMSDHLWGNECTEIIHDGAETSRIGKIKYIAEDKDALQILRVCWHDKGYNCGECEKCLRTMASLRALGLSTPSFPECTDELVKSKLAKLNLYEEYVGAYLDENLAAAKESQDEVLIRALTQIQRRSQRRQLFHLVDDMMGGILSNAKKRVR